MSSVDCKQKNFFGLWEKSLHVDLAWVSAPYNAFKFLPDLRLPSWTWMAYDGRVVFHIDRRNKRHATVMYLVRAVRLISTDAPDLPDLKKPLPLQYRAPLTVRVRLQKLPSTIGNATEFAEDFNGSWDEVVRLLPFELNAESRLRPILLAEISNSRTLSMGSTMVGFGSFDTEIPTEFGDLYCAHISTLRSGSRVLEPSITTTTDHPAAKRAPKSVLAYGLILRRIGVDSNEYIRIGLGEFNYRWMIQGKVETIQLC